ncbi:spore germination protein [Bacillus sp. JCM 19034]|uniref:spore germination protein n=1 Tax=Bacillus sp. JCM 19034 TaxID=1481928 RepID=UPI000783F3F8|nr:spore germination protein [Bacillus sp. JCM 19034]
MFRKKRQWKKTIKYVNKQKKSIDPTLKNSVKEIKDIIGQDLDYNERELEILGNQKIMVIYLASLVNKDSINSHIIKPMLALTDQQNNNDLKKSKSEIKDQLFEAVIYHSQGKKSLL